MILKEIEIIDFKSIKKEKVVLRSNQTCFVGKNECGKSSLIQAISYLNLTDLEYESNLLNKQSISHPSGYPSIAGKFELEKKEFSGLLKILEKYIESESLSKLPKESGNSSLYVHKWAPGISNVSFLLTDEKEYALNISETISEKAAFYEEFFNSIYPTIEYYENEELLIEAATVDELIGTDKKFETFRRLLYLGGCKDLNLLSHDNDDFVANWHAQIESNINTILKKHYKQDESIEVNLRTIKDNKINLVIKDNSKSFFSIRERSPGFRYYFSFLINKLFTTQKHKGKSFIFLLDEPGTSLHPEGSKDLLKTFGDIAGNSQILYTTHNPFLTIRNDVDSLYLVKKSPKDGTKIEVKPYLNRYQIIRKELGILLNDSFLIGDINLIVEGATEKLAFHRLFQNEDYSSLQWMNIYNAGGVTNVSQSLNFLGPNNLDLTGVVLLDSDQEAEVEKTKSGFTNALKTKKWEALEINDAFKDKQSRTFEDLFPQNLYVAAFNSYCQSLKNSGVFDSEYKDYPYHETIKTPIINTLAEHFFSFIKEERHKQNSIAKQDVARMLLDQIETLNDAEKTKAMETCHLLIEKMQAIFKKLEKNVSH